MTRLPQLLPISRRMLQQKARNNQRITGRVNFPAVLGDGLGNISVPGSPEYYYFRQIESDSADETVYGAADIALASGAAIIEQDGFPIIIGYQRGQQVVLAPRPTDLVRRNINPRITNPLSPYNQFVLLQYAVLGYASRVGTTITPTMEVWVKPFYFIDADGTYKTVGDTQVDFAASIPAADGDGNNMQVLAGLFLKTDDTFAIITSTPKLLENTLNHEDDLVEVFSLAPARAMPIRAFKLYTGQTLISDTDEFSDIRGWLNTIRRKNNYTATVAPTVNDDIDLGYEPGSVWFNTVTELFYLCKDATADSAVWHEDITAKITGIAEYDQLVWDEVNDTWINVPILKDKKELIGFAEGSRVKATLSFDNPTRTLTVSHISDYNIYDDSVMYPITGDLTRQISDDEGVHYFYYQAGALTSIHAPSAAERLNLFSILALTAVVYWDKTNQRIIYLGEERHGTNIPGSVHKESHFTRGTWYYDDGGLGFSNFDIDGSGNDDSNVHFAVANGTAYDEDIEHNVSNANQTLSPIAEMPIYYLDGTDWRRFWIDTAWQDAHVYSLGDQIRGDDSYFEVTTAGTSGGVEPTWAGNTEPGDPVVDNTVTWTCIGSPRANVRNFVGGTYRLAYNQLVGASWQQTEVNNGSFVLAHVMATNNLLDNQLMVVIQGQAQYSTIIAAREGATNEVNELQTIGLPFAEFVFIGTATYQTSNGYSNEAKSKIRTTDTGADYVDFRSSSISSGGGTVSDHNTLGGLELAGPGVTYGHIDDQVQTIAGAKTLTGKLTHQDSATIAPMNVTERSAAPSAPVTEDVYLDDGTNTASSNPGWRRYTGTVWEDISAGAGGGSASTVARPCTGRLTLTSGNPNDPADVTGATLYYTQMTGNADTVYNTVSGNWDEIEYPEMSLALGALVANALYDIYEYDNAGTLTLEGVSRGINAEYNISIMTAADPCVITYWHTSQIFAVGDDICIQAITGDINTVTHVVTSVTAIATVSAGVSYSVTIEIDTTGLTYTSGGTVRLLKQTYVTAITTQDGIPVKTGELNKRYIGTILIGGDGGETSMTDGRQHVANYYNRVERILNAILGAASAISSASISATDYVLIPTANTCKDGVGRVSYVAPYRGASIDATWATGVNNTGSSKITLLLLEQNKIVNSGVVSEANSAFGWPNNAYQSAFSKLDAITENEGYNYIQKLWLVSASTGSVWVGNGTSFEFGLGCKILL